MAVFPRLDGWLLIKTYIFISSGSGEGKGGRTNTELECLRELSLVEKAGEMICQL